MVKFRFIYWKYLEKLGYLEQRENTRVKIRRKILRRPADFQEWGKKGTLLHGSVHTSMR